MDSVEPDHLAPEGDPEDPEAGQEQPEGEPRFPVIILAAPGCVFALFVVMADVLAGSLGSVRLAMIVAVAATIGAVACFAIIAAKTPERHVQIASAIGIGMVIFALAAAILSLT